MANGKKRRSPLKWVVGGIVVLPVLFVAAVLILLAAKGQLKLPQSVQGMLGAEFGTNSAGGSPDSEAELKLTTRGGPYAGELVKLRQELKAELEVCRTKKTRLTKHEGRLKIAQEDLETMKTQLLELRKELLTAAEDLARREQELDRKIILLKQNEQDNFKRMADTYKSMNSLKAAEILDGMSEREVVKILSLIESRSRAKILEAMTSEKAAELTRLMQNFRKELPTESS